ncbi:trimethyllysine dioxygenase, mitochondrial-like [Bolinopsis microptera]|uniref:trimethyllysine dioxygenase, mitochondrial-like n=1 Tax=Bolinopsis microptera TaxID=2820187 RepID=UPI0030796F1A
MLLSRLPKLKHILASTKELLLRSHSPSERHLSDRVKLTEHGIRDNDRDLLHVETRNMCCCETCFGKHSHQKTGQSFRTGNLHPGAKVTDIGKVSEHYVSLTWSDGHTGLVARTIRGEYGPEPVPTILDKYLDLSMRYNRCQEFWSAKTDKNSKVFDYNTVISSVGNTRDFLAHYMIHGIGFLTGIPANKEMLDIIADLKCGPIRETIFGGVDVVRFKPNPANAGYGSGSLAGHTDLNYYYQSSSMLWRTRLREEIVSGLTPSQQSQKSEKRDQTTLISCAECQYTTVSPGTDNDVRSHHTLMTMLGEDIFQISDNPWSTDTPLATYTLDLETRRQWWEAYLYYRAKVEDQSRWIMRKLEGGEVVVLDNFRVYHGRKEFGRTEHGQERMVGTAYVNWNHLQRVLLSPVEAEPCFLETEKH